MDITPTYIVALIVFTLSLCTTTFIYVLTLGKRMRGHIAPFPTSMYAPWIVMVIASLFIDAMLWTIIFAIIGALVWINDYDRRLQQWNADNEHHDNP